MIGWQDQSVLDLPAPMLLDAVQDGVFAVATDGTCRVWNDTMARMTGTPERDVLGLHPGDQHPVLAHPGVARCIGAALRCESVEPLKFVWEHPASGQERISTARFTTLRNRGGEITGAMVTISDTTELELAITDREAVAARLHSSQKMEGIGSLAGGVAHDLNNVLGSVLGLASANRERLKDSADTALLNALDTIIQSSLRGRSVVKSLLYVAQMGIGDAHPIDLNSLVRDMMDLMAHTCPQVDVRVDLDPALGTVSGDPTGISQALMHLCTNAVEAMPSGGGLTVRTSQLGKDRLELVVVDEGVGMAPEITARATEPFFTTKPGGEMAGLGLAMVAGTVKAHQGTLEIQSRPGGGTEVRLVLPCLQAHTSPGATGVAGAVGTEKLDILVVDDDPLMVTTIQVMLQRMGHHPRTTMRGADAIAILESGYQPDLITLDMIMPGMSGAETLVEIHKRRPGQKVLIASGHSEEDIRRMVGSGPNLDSIQKPFTMDELRARIQALSGTMLSKAC